MARERLGFRHGVLLGQPRQVRLPPDPRSRPVPIDRPIEASHSRGLQVPAATVSEVGVKPRLRGVFHQYAFFVSLAGGTLLVLLAATTRASVAAAIYATSVSALFGVSALYHRVSWNGPARRRMRRLDHAETRLTATWHARPITWTANNARSLGP
jgi:hypothetical protein